MSFIDFYKTYELLSFKKGWKKSTSCLPEEAKVYSTHLCEEVLRADEFQVYYSEYCITLHM